MLIGFVGLTHLGLCTMAACTVKGHKTIGYLEKKNKFDLKSIYFEKDLKKILSKKSKNFKVTNSMEDLNKCDFIYISEDIPTNNKGISNLRSINKLIISLFKIISSKIPIIILSQVHPGFTRKICNLRENIYYQVETLIFGSAIERALRPERIIIGLKNKNQKINVRYNNFIKSFKCPIIKMNYESAEFTKIAINLYLISSVSMTNIVSGISRSINVEWPDVKKALILDKRIGKHAYLDPGLGISGGNLERDLETVKSFTSNQSIEKIYFQLFSKISKKMKKWPFRVFINLLKDFPKIKKIGILGLSYKKNTNSIKNSPSISFMNDINIYTKNNKMNIQFIVYDPVAKIDNKFLKVNQTKSLKSLFKKVDVLYILSPWDEFKLDAKKIFNNNNIQYIVDPFKVLKNSNNFKNRYFSL